MNSAWLVRSHFCGARGCAGSYVFSSFQTAKASRIVFTFPRPTSHRSYSVGAELQKQHEVAPRVAIVGSGPAGFYTARKLMREIHGTKIDMYEQLPVPFGLVRFGVAPDHPEVKNCQDEFEQVASSPDFTFVGNLHLGSELPLLTLANHYDAIVFSYGASKDRKLGLAGEDQPHIYSARAFVGWYNGLPKHRNLKPDLQSGETAIVVGQGNVALDVARILLSRVEDLKKTDLTDYAIQALGTSRIKRVHVVGRRGPMQAAFTIKEVRELIQLQGVNFEAIPGDLFPPDHNKLERPKRRLMQLLQKGKPHDPTATKTWSLDFLLAPSSLEWSDTDSNKLAGVTFTKTHLENISDPSSKVSSTTETTTIPTSTLFRSIGYKAEPIPGMDLIGAAFNERSGTLNHDGFGRIIPLDEAAMSSGPTHSTALYCAGWVKRGPTGVIASTMADAFQTAEAIVKDWRHKLTTRGSSEGQVKQGWTAVKADAQAQGYKLDKVVNWDGWHKIDQAEKKVGSERGKPREKIGVVEEMVQVASAA